MSSVHIGNKTKVAIHIKHLSYVWYCNIIKISHHKYPNKIIATLSLPQIQNTTNHSMMVDQH